MKITKQELKVIAAVITHGEISLHYMHPDVKAARSLAKKGLISCPCPEADYEKFKPTRKGIRRMLHGTS